MNTGKQNDLYIAFVDLEKTFNEVPRNNVWWVLMKVAAEERLIKFIQSIYWNP